MQSSQAENINNNFFDGYYKNIWRSIIPEALTRAEVDFLVEEARLQTGSKVLDLMCGYGRHALALARKGIGLTAVDNLGDYIDEIKEIAEKENLPVQALQEDVMGFQPGEEYDLIICMGNSLCFFNENDSLDLLAKISSHLKLGGKFIFSTWMIAEIVFKNFMPKSWTEIAGMRYLNNSKFLFSPTRLETETVIIPQGGTEEIKKAIDYIYSVNETEIMLKKSGLAMKDIWSIPGKKKFTLGEPRAYIVAGKINKNLI
jgi:SAM-dependent methyltransferase